MGLYCPVWPCVVHMVPYRPVWSRMVLYGLYGTVWYLMVLYGPIWSRMVGEWKVELSFLEAKAMVDLSLSNRSMKVKTFSSKSPCLVEILTDSGLKMSKIGTNF